MPVRAESRSRPPAAVLRAAGSAGSASLAARALPGFASLAAPALPGLAALALLGLAACTSVEAEPLALVSVQPVLRMTLGAETAAPATAVSVTVSLGVPLDAPDQALTIVGVREAAATPGERSLLELTLHWTDFRADQPRCTGRSQDFLLPFLESGTAEPGAALRVMREVQLPAPTGLVARRVRARARIIGVDLQLPAGHSGGTLLTLPDATLDSVPPPPPGTLEEHLQSRSAPGIFLSAASAPPAQREALLGTLIRALPSTPEPARGAIYAALLFLTGETHGRDMYRWSSWWKSRTAPPLKG